MRFVFAFVLATASGQSIVYSAGYAAPSPAPQRIAPGQIFTIFVSGVMPNTSGPVSVPGGQPLPTTLAGLTAQIAQAGSGLQSPLIPILAVVPHGSPCPPIAYNPNCLLTWVSVQIPYEITYAIPGEGGFPSSVFLTVSDGTNSSTPIELSPVEDQIHVLTDDTIRQSLNGGQMYPLQGPAITHANGALVDLANPAIPGEELVMYTVGLGLAPNAKTGQPTASPAISLRGFSMKYDYTANAAPSSNKPPTAAPGPGAPDPSILFVGLVPGLVGTYQVNFVIPSPPGPLTPCGAAVVSNLTVSLNGSYSFDGAGICVAQ
jgi:uncharacterized protein (TIGR03437 family)